MTVAALPSTVEYFEDGVSTTFAVPFRFRAASDLVVERVFDGTVQRLQLGVDYAVTGGATDAGGTLTRTAAPTGARLQIRRETARAQPMIYTVGDRFPAESHEEALDRATLIAQELDANVSDVRARALLVPPGEAATRLPTVAARRGRFLAFDAAGEAVPASGLGADAALRPDLADPMLGGQLISFDGRRTMRQRLELVAYVTDARFAGGADPSGGANSTAAIQAALDFVEADGGGTVLVPEGLYYTTAPLRLPPRTRLLGAGPCSIIWAHACHGLEVLRSNDIAPRGASDIRFYAAGGAAYSGIFADIEFTDEDPARAQGLTFQNVFLDFFGTGVSGRGFWHTSFKTVSINQCHRGFFFFDRNVKVVIDECRLIRGGLVGGAGPSIGIQVGDDNVGYRPEDVQVTLSMVFGFDIAVKWRNCLFGGVTNNDLDGCGQKGIEITTADGGTTFDDNWIDVVGTTGNLYGIHGVPLGYIADPINISITNNRIRVNETETPGAEAADAVFENNQSNILFMGNSLTGEHEISLRAEGVRRSKFVANNGSGQARFFNLNGCNVDKNTFLGGYAVSGNVQTALGANDGLHGTELIGQFVMPAGQTVATRTWLSMNLPDLPIGAENISCPLSERGALNHGGHSAIPTRTGLTVYVTSPLGADALFDFHLRLF